MKKLRKTLSLLLALLTVCVCIAGVANAAYAKTGDQRKDIVGIALTQVGNTNSTHIYRNDNNAWCASFVIWCARQAGIDAKIIKDTGWATADDLGITYKGRSADRKTGINYTPQPGDIIIFDWEYINGKYDGYTYKAPASFYGDHVGIVVEVKNGRVYTVEGNSGGMVRKNDYPLTYSEIKGYGIPNYKTNTVQKTTTIAACADYTKYSTPSSADYAYWTGSYVAKASGTTLSEIKWMQAALNYCIKYKGLKVSGVSQLDLDGSFGPASTKACKAFQKQYGLTQDGSFGPNTIATMVKVLNGKL